LICSSNTDKILDHFKHKEIVNWLKVCDPSTNHYAARQAYEPGTGIWFVESSDFIEWRDNQNRSLWLQAIPGAGKTILCSTIIEEVRKFCKAQPEYRCTYFYFDFADEKKQVVTSFLRSIIMQLFDDRQEIPNEVQSLYDSHKGNQPMPEALVKTILSLIKTFPQTYILIDALDECRERKEMVKILKELISSSNSFNLLITSRKEQDIITELQRHIQVIKCIESAKVDADVELYVHRYLDKDSTLKRCRPVKNEVTKALVEGSNGMYISAIVGTR
jgi:hypothetical protein